MQIQAQETKIEVGAQFSALRVNISDENLTDSGFGGRLTYNLKSSLALEGELNFFPKDSLFTGRKVEGLFGIKSGWRREKFGLFGKVRPGFVHFGKEFGPPGYACILVFPAPIGCSVRRTDLALDLGGVIEIYPSKKFLLRFDGGDTIIRFVGRGSDPIKVTRHSFQLSSGVGFRF